MNFHKTIIPAVILITAVLTSCGCSGSGYGTGRLAPDFTLLTYAGETESLSSLHGRVTLLVFWFPT